MPRGVADGRSERDDSAPSFAILGPLRVLDGAGAPLHPGGLRQRLALVILLLHANHPVSADTLVDGLWPHRPPPSALATLHGYVSRLRRLLEPHRRGRTAPSIISHSAAGYELDVHADQLDLLLFRSFITEGHHQARREPLLARRCYEDAISLWRGEPLADPAFSHVAQGFTAEVRELHLGAAEALHDLRLDAGEHRELVPELRRYVEAHGLRERGWAQLMIALYRSGRQAEALRAYRDLASLLVEELGLSPSPAITQLEAAILVQDPALLDEQRSFADSSNLSDARPIASLAPPGVGGRQRFQDNLPNHPDPLLGRAEDTAAVIALVRAHRLVTLIGIGGIGKTRLAIAAATKFIPTSEDGVWFADLAAVQSPERLAERIADAAGLTLSGGVGHRQLAEVLAQRSPLIVLDNCEHLAVAVGDLVASLLTTTGAKFLVTSREPLGIGSEWLFAVPTLAVGDSLDSPAVALLAASAARAGYTIGTEDLADASRLCHAIDGIPLALELAGAQLRYLTCQELSSRLGDSLDLLQRWPARSSRQAGLLSILDNTWDSLNDDERELLQLLGTFASHFELSAAEAAARPLRLGSEAAAFAGLASRSLLQSSAAGHRLLEPVKSYVQHHWRDPASRSDYRACHRDWVLGSITSESPEARHTSLVFATWVATYSDDLRVVEDHAASNRRAVELVDVLGAHNLAVGYGNPTRAAAVLGRIERYVGEFSFTNAHLARLHLVACLAGVGALQPTAMADHAARAMELFADHDNAADRAMAFVVHAMTVRDIDRACVDFEHARTIATEAGDAHVGNLALAYCAITCLARGQRSRARGYLQEISDLLPAEGFRAPNSVFLQAVTVDNLIDAPSHASASCDAMIQAQHALGMPYTEPWRAYPAYTAASCGLVEQSHAAIHSLEGELHRNGIDPARDVLLPSVILAWRLEDIARARRWLASISHAGPMRRFAYVAVYRQLLSLPEFASLDSLAPTDISEDASEALLWLDGLCSAR